MNIESSNKEKEKINSKNVNDKINNWSKNSIKFNDFVKKYKNKINAKIKNITNSEDLKDIEFEVEIAFLILKNDNIKIIEYEKRKKGPDYTITTETDNTFNIEVKRIRKTDIERKMEKWEQEIAKYISSFKVPLGISIIINQIKPIFSDREDFIGRIKINNQNIGAIDMRLRLI